MNAKINMDAVIAEFKALIAYEKRCFQSMSKHEQRELRAQRKSVSQYVEQVIVDWRATKAEETACETHEIHLRTFFRWNMRSKCQTRRKVADSCENPHELVNDLNGCVKVGLNLREKIVATCDVLVFWDAMIFCNKFAR